MKIIIAALIAFIVGLPRAISASASLSHQELQSRVELGALNYFGENSNPVTGLTLDSATNVGRRGNQIAASMAATGFSLAVLSNAADRGLADKNEVYQYALKTLLFSRDHLERWHGWFAHFVDWKTGARLNQSEFSTIDTAIFMAGALYAAQIFPNTRVAEVAHHLYEDLDFQTLLTNGGRYPKKLTLSMGYIPEEGYIATQWDMYAEEMILLVLGLGHPTHPLPAKAWLAFSREQRGGIMGWDQALFVHQYSQLFLDLRNFDDGFPNYSNNSVNETLHQRDLAKNDSRYRTFQEGFWGFSAGLGPGHTYEVANSANYSGTACIGCALGSVMFRPVEVMNDLAKWSAGPYANHIWGRYGLVDSLNLDQNWFADAVFGITVGPAYLSFANANPTTSVWSKFMAIPDIQRGLERASQDSLR